MNKTHAFLNIIPNFFCITIHPLAPFFSGGSFTIVTCLCSEEKYQQFQVDTNLQYTCAACRGECSQVLVACHLSPCVPAILCFI
jgi:hypothetical protein